MAEMDNLLEMSLFFSISFSRYTPMPFSRQSGFLANRKDKGIIEDHPQATPRNCPPTPETAGDAIVAGLPIQRLLPEPARRTPSR